MDWKILKTQAKSSLLSKILSKTLSPRLLSLSPNLNGANEDHRVEFRVYIEEGRVRETQESLDN